MTLPIASLLTVVWLSQLATPPSLVPSNIKLAHRFVYGAYPSVASKLSVSEARIEATLSVNTVRLNIVDAPPGRMGRTLLTGMLTFDKDGLVDSFAASGPLTLRDANASLDDLLASREVVTTDEIMKVVAAARGRITTKAALMELGLLKNRDWLTLFGAAPRVGDCRFGWSVNASAPSVRVNRRMPVWIVDLASTTSDGRPVLHELYFEPFSGSLVGALRVTQP
jgi:hypothetical protein